MRTDMTTPSFAPGLTPRRALLLVAVLLGGILVVAEKPWETGIAETIAREGKASLDDYIADGLWWATACNLALTLSLWAAWPLWNRPLSPKPDGPPASFHIMGVRRAPFLLLLGVILLVALAERAPRLGLSLWNDEEYTLRRYVHGTYEPGPEQPSTLDAVTWKETFFHNRGANNHIPFSLSAKTALAVHGLFDRHTPYFSEAALRLPALLAGLASVALAGWLVATRVDALAGLSTALLLALHPWHVRYSVEARGYAFLLVFLTLATLLLTSAIRSGRWRDWLGYALFQFLYMWSFPGAVYLAVCMNAVAFLILTTERPFAGRGAPMLARLIVANLTSAALFLQFMGPSIRQIHLYLQRDIALGKMGTDWMLDVWSHILTGTRWIMDDSERPQFLSLQHIVPPGPVFQWLSLAILLCCLLGIARSFRTGRAALLVVVPPVAAAGFAYVHNKLGGNFLFSWYILYVLSGLVPAFFHGATWPAALPGLRKIRRPASAALCALPLLAYTAATWDTRAHLRDVPRQPLREAVTAVRGSIPAAHGSEGSRMLSASVGTSNRQFASYDPWITPLDESDSTRNAALLRALMMQCAKSGKPLAVYFSGGRQSESSEAEVLGILETDAFRKIGSVDGLEEFFHIDIYLHEPQRIDASES